MNTLYLYGDSFGIDHNIYWQWFKQIGNYRIINHSVTNTSNDYILHTVLQELHKYKKNDLVIILSTDINREWILQNRPELGNYLNQLRLEEHVNKKELEALYMYANFLYNEDKLAAVNYAINQSFYNIIKNIKCKGICIPSFSSHSDTVVSGNLTEHISFREFVNTTARHHYFLTQEDSRPNHMIKTNHLILAKKIKKYIKKEQENINLLEGFKTGFLC